jgi:hypothetical protein
MEEAEKRSVGAHQCGAGERSRRWEEKLTSGPEVAVERERGEREDGPAGGVWAGRRDGPAGIVGSVC